MKLLTIHLKTLQPVLVKAPGDEPNTVSSLNWLPARVILGAVATHWLKQNKVASDSAHRDPVFKRLFLSTNGPRFFPAYPVDNEGKIAHKAPACYGIKKANIHNDNKIFQNFLDDDPEYGVQYKPLEGFISNDLKTGITVPMVDTFHHKRDRYTGSTEAGQIFHYSAIDEGTSFLASIRGSEEDLDLIQSLLEQGDLWLGRSRTAQYGRVKCQIVERTDVALVKIKSDENTILFRSPVILSSANGMVSMPSSEVLEKVYFEDMWKVGTDHIYGRTENILSYQSVKRQNLTAKTAISAGTVLKLIRSKIGSDDDAVQLLQKLQFGGLGLNIKEGFGWVEFNPRLPEMVIIQSDGKANNATEPTGEIPLPISEIIKRQVRTEVQNHILKQISTVAFSTMSGALAGRLLGLCRQAKSYSIFEGELKNLAKPAKDKLEKVWLKNQGTNFRIYLKNFQEQVVQSVPHDYPLSEKLKLRDDKDYIEGVTHDTALLVLKFILKSIRINGKGQA
ncbi:MAG: hypothetical protein H3C47_14425 [Candidatus Cloacimonetes bacterium]|nr:hypothetical protein [Candidatus Cloacimonadota bacterium]